MTWTILALVVIIWVGRKFRPAHLGDDILKFEIFRHLRYRNARDAAEHMSYEDLEKRQWLRFTVMTLFVSGFSYLSLGSILGFTAISCISTSSVIVAMWCVSYLRFTKTFRQTTLPLFATLCRIPQTRWDIRDRPWNWVRVNLNQGRVFIRLPKDWHATKPALKNVAELVNARVPGTWAMEADTRKFLLTFRREPEPQIILVSSESEPQNVEELDFEIEEKDVENEPW